MIEYCRAPSRVGDAALRARAEADWLAVGSTDTTERTGNTRSAPSKPVLGDCWLSFCVTDRDRSLLPGRPSGVGKGPGLGGVATLSDRFREPPISGSGGFGDAILAAGPINQGRQSTMSLKPRRLARFKVVIRTGWTAQICAEGEAGFDVGRAEIGRAERLTYRLSILLFLGHAQWREIVPLTATTEARAVQDTGTGRDDRVAIADRSTCAQASM